MNYYKANPALLALDSKYLLSAAYAVAGDKVRSMRCCQLHLVGKYLCSKQVAVFTVLSVMKPLH